MSGGIKKDQTGKGFGEGRGMGESKCRGIIEGKVRHTREKLCICPKCGATTSNSAGVPCYLVNCTECGSAMISKF